MCNRPNAENDANKEASASENLPEAMEMATTGDPLAISKEPETTPMTPKEIYQVAKEVVHLVCGKKDDNGKMMKGHAAYPNLKRCLYLDEKISWLKFGKDVKRQVIRIIEFSSLEIKFQTDFSEKKMFLLTVY